MLTKAFEFSLKELDALGEFEGYASTFRNVDRQGDKIAPGAFAETLKEHKGRVPILMGHDTGRIVGFGTGAEEDSHGLKVWGQFTVEADEGRNAYALARHAQQVKQPIKLSIGYGVREGGAKRDDKTGIRTLTAIDLYEYSLVAVPANPRAQVTTVKSAEMTVREFEDFLRESGGFSKELACAIASRSKDVLKDRGEPDASGMNELFGMARSHIFVNEQKERLRCPQAQR